MAAAEAAARQGAAMLSRRLLRRSLAVAAPPLSPPPLLPPPSPALFPAGLPSSWRQHTTSQNTPHCPFSLIPASNTNNPSPSARNGNHMRVPSPPFLTSSSPVQASQNSATRLATTNAVLYHGPLRATARPSWLLPTHIIRGFFSSRPVLDIAGKSEAQAAIEAANTKSAEEKKADEEHNDYDHLGFGKSEKAAKAARVNLAARLSRQGGDAKDGGKPGVNETWRLLRIASHEARWFAVAVACLLTSSAIVMALPYTIGRVLDLSATGKAGDDVEIMGLKHNQFYVCMGIVIVIGAIANFGRALTLRIIGERIVARLRTRLFRHAYIQDAEFYDANRTGDLISRLSTDTTIVGKSITGNVADGLRAAVMGSAAFSAMAYMSPMLTLTIVCMAPPIGLCVFYYGRITRRISRRQQTALGHLTKIAEERLSNVRTSQSFTGEIQEVRRYATQVRKLFELGRWDATVNGMFWGFTGFAGNISIMILLIVGGSLVRSGAMTLGDLTSFMMYTVFAGSSFNGLTGFYGELMRGLGAATRLFELMDRQPGISATRGIKVGSAQGPIRFEKVTFAYPTRPAVNIFNGLTFEIPSGSHVCIVGPSGGGKSTVAGLLLGFYRPTSGRITINGVDVADMNLKSLRRRVGVVAQEPVLFSGSIADNIAYGRPHARPSEVMAAARRANCGFISDFPEGIRTQVGARGAQLSGGQKQRIAIARALIKDPDILVLDEATSALDAQSETLINEAFAGLLHGRSTTISIAHRLSTIRRSDRLIVLSADGCVAEVGTFRELDADKNSAFSKLIEWQLTGGESMPRAKTIAGPKGEEEEEEEREEEEEGREHEEDDDAKDWEEDVREEEEKRLGEEKARTSK